MEVTEAGRALLVKADRSREVVMEAREMELFVEQHFGDTHTLSVRRDAFRQLGGYPPGRAVCEDVHFLIRLCTRSYRVGVVCQPMGAYCVHGESATRRDPLHAQVLNVQTLLALRDSLGDVPQPILRGYLRRLRRARLNLAYSLLRQSRGREAVRAVLPSLRDAPGVSGFRDVASITWNAVRQACSS
jgi:GT2 family glycosyltransferase